MAGLSMNSIATGNDPGSDDGGHAGARGPRSRESRRENGPRIFRAAQDAHDRLGDDSDLTLGPHGEAKEVEGRANPAPRRRKSTSVPSIRTMRTPSTLLVVTPYLRQCAPPEFIPILPPIVQASWEDGSGA